MKMRHRKKRVVHYSHNPDKFISADELNARILELKTLIAKRWLEGTAETFAQAVARVNANLQHPSVKDE